MDVSQNKFRILLENKIDGAAENHFLFQQNTEFTLSHAHSAKRPSP
jgi:hypothetical protein